MQSLTSKLIENHREESMTDRQNDRSATNKLLSQNTTMGTQKIKTEITTDLETNPDSSLLELSDTDLEMIAGGVAAEPERFDGGKAGEIDDAVPFPDVDSPGSGLKPRKPTSRGVRLGGLGRLGRLGGRI